MITLRMKPGGNRPPGDNPLLFSISGTGSCICPVAQARLDTPGPLIVTDHIHGALGGGSRNVQFVWDTKHFGIKRRKKRGGMKWKAISCHFEMNPPYTLQFREISSRTQYSFSILIYHDLYCIGWIMTCSGNIICKIKARLSLTPCENWPRGGHWPREGQFQLRNTWVNW